jgi:RNA polymerase sigma-70 factor (ECF subfamily)
MAFSPDAESRLSALIATYRRLVRSVIARAGGRTLRDSRDDVEQQVWVAIWRRLQSEQEIDHPTSYLYTVARREALRAVEEELARIKHTEQAPPPKAAPADDPDRVLLSQESGERIAAALTRLAPDRRRAMQATLNGLDVYEIQDLFGWSYDRARNLIARGRADLRAILEEDR